MGKFVYMEKMHIYVFIPQNKVYMKYEKKDCLGEMIDNDFLRLQKLFYRFKLIKNED